MNSSSSQPASRSSSSSFFDRSLHPFKGEGEKEEEEWSRRTEEKAGEGGREKMMTKPVFASLPSFFPFTKVKVAQLGPFPRQSPLIQRRSSGEGTMRGLLLARVGRGDTSSAQCRMGSRFGAWLRRIRFHVRDDGKGAAKYRKYVAHFKATAGFTPHDHDQDRRPLLRRAGHPANAYARLA